MMLIFSVLIFSNIDGMGQPFVSLGRLIDPITPSVVSNYFKSEEQKRLLYGILTSLLLTSPGLFTRNRPLAFGLPLSVLAGSYLYNYIYPQENVSQLTLPASQSSKSEQPPAISEQGKLDEDLERMIKAKKQEDSLYAFIGVSEDAKKKAIKERIKFLELKFHPDKLTEYLKKQIEKQGWEYYDSVFKAVGELKLIFLNDDARKVYDESGYEAAKAFISREDQGQVSDEVKSEIPFIIANNKTYMDVIADFTLNKKISLTESDKSLIEEITKKNNQVLLDIFASLRTYFPSITIESKDSIIRLVSRIKDGLNSEDHHKNILDEWIIDLRQNGYTDSMKNTIFSRLQDVIKSESYSGSIESKKNDGGVADID